MTKLEKGQSRQLAGKFEEHKERNYSREIGSIR